MQLKREVKVEAIIWELLSINIVVLLFKSMLLRPLGVMDRKEKRSEVRGSATFRG